MTTNSERPQKREISLLKLSAGVLLGLFCVAGATIVWLWTLPRENGIPIGRETTFITEPVDQDGYVDYLAALQPEKPLPAEDNAAGCYVQVCGWDALQDLPSYSRAAICEQLDIQLPLDPASQIQYFDDFAQRWLEQNRSQLAGVEIDDDAVYESYDRCLNAPWKSREFPVVAEWLEANTPAYELIIEGSKRRGYQFRPAHDGTLDTYPLPLEQEQRNFARLLKIRAMLHLGEGELAASETQIEAIRRLSRHHNPQPFLIEQLISAAIDSIAYEASVALIAHMNSANEIRRLRSKISKLPPVAKYVDSFNRPERFLVLSTLQEIDREARKLRPRGAAPMPRSTTKGPAKSGLLRDLHVRQVDVADCSRRVNRHFDKRVAAMSLAKPLRHAALTNVDEEFGASLKLGASDASSPIASSTAISNAVLAYFTKRSDNFSFYILNRDLAVRQKLLDIACAARLFELETGRAAKKQSDLVPKYLATWPTCEIRDAPIKEATIRNQWVVYFQSPPDADRPVERLPQRQRIDIPHSADAALNN